MRRFFASFALLLFASQAFATSSWQESFDTGRTHFDAGQWQKAYSAFYHSFLIEPGNPEISFLLGRAAYEKGDFENAVMAFDRVLILNPTPANRTKLELARSYMGLKAWSPARQYFQEVLATSPPPAVERNIRAMLASISEAQKRHFLSGAVSLEVSIDNNAHTSPANDTIRTVVGDVILNGTGAQSVNDQVLTSSMALNHAYKGDSGMIWKSSGILLNSSYKSEDTLDINYLAISSGPSGQWGKLAWQLQGIGSLLELDNQSYLTLGGLSTSFGVDISSQFQVIFFGKGELKNYRTIAGRDAVTIQIGVSPIIAFGQQRISLTLAGERENAKADVYSYDKVVAGFRLERQLAHSIIISVGEKYSKSSYDQEEILFGLARSDELWETSISLTGHLLNSKDRRRNLTGRFGYTNFNSNSNISLYTYDKDVVTASLSMGF